MKKIITLLLIAATLMVSCTHPPEADPKDQPFCLSDTMQKKIILSDVRHETVKNEITLSGKVEANEDKRVKVFPVIDGVVQSLSTQLGDYVHKGQTLAVIRSSSIADVQNQVSYTRSNVSTARKNLQSNEEMFKAGLATEKDVVASKNELAKAMADEKRAGQLSQIYGARSNSLQYIVAPVSGFIIEKNVTDKMQFQAANAQPFFIISNLDEVWIMANVFESDIDKIKVGYDAEISVMAYKGKIYHGKVDRVFSVLDPQTRVMKVRIRIPNTGFSLKPEMFAQVNIKYDDTGVMMLSVPARAVIFDKDKNFIMVYKDKCHIETREVEVYKTSGDVTYVKSGVSEGEKIISQNQLLLYDALND